MRSIKSGKREFKNTNWKLEEMPWTESAKEDDIRFLLEIIEKAKSRDLWEELDFEPEESIIIPWLDTFGNMIREA